MKNTFEQDNYIFDLWKNKNLTFEQIAQMEIPNSLSLKRVRNICYAGRAAIKNKTEFGIYIIYRLKWLGNHNINKSIYFAYENQPKIQLSERCIRRIVNKKNRNKQFQNYI